MMLSKHLKEKIQQKPIQHLDMLYELLPENEEQAQKILQLMDELIKEKKLNPHLLYRHMEKPLFFQDKSEQDFIKRNPLIAKLVRVGGLPIFNYYLKFKYGSALSAELLTRYDIFIFDIPPIQHYIDNAHLEVLAAPDDINRIYEKYYAVYGTSYELLGDIFQEKKRTILQRLIECKFDFNKETHIEHLKKYIYINFDKPFVITDENIQFLIENGLSVDQYLNVFLTGLWDEFAIVSRPIVQTSLIHLINFLLENNASLAQFPRDFLEKMQHLLENKINATEVIHSHQLQEMYYLNASFIECLQSLDHARAFYMKAGQRGIQTIRRKELLGVLTMMKNLSNTE